MIVELAPEAEIDLEEIGDFIARDDPIRADSFVAEVQSSCRGLKEFPSAYPLVARFEEFGIRRRKYGNYGIYYRVTRDAVIVLRILHGARDHDEILFPD